MCSWMWSECVEYIPNNQQKNYDELWCVEGGVDKDLKPRISYLKPGGIAHRSDAVEEGDYILTVNGVRTSSMNHDDIVSLLRGAGENVTLELQYELPELHPQNSFSVLCKQLEVRLDGRDGDSFGFCLRGGLDSEPVLCRPLTVTQIRPGGAADREGTLKVGDRILGINGTDASQATLPEALKLLRHTHSYVTLLIEYDVSVMDAVEKATGPLLVEIDKAPGSGLGISVAAGKVKDSCVIIIDSIQPASIADRCGALHVGDVILAIDDTSFEHVSVAEAAQILKCTTGSHVRIEIMPARHVRARGDTPVSIGSDDGPAKHSQQHQAPPVRPQCRNAASTPGTSTSDAGTNSNGVGESVVDGGGGGRGGGSTGATLQPAHPKSRTGVTTNGVTSQANTRANTLPPKSTLQDLECARQKLQVELEERINHHSNQSGGTSGSDPRLSRPASDNSRGHTENTRNAPSAVGSDTESRGAGSKGRANRGGSESDTRERNRNVHNNNNSPSAPNHNVLTQAQVHSSQTSLNSFGTFTSLVTQMGSAANSPSGTLTRRLPSAQSTRPTSSSQHSSQQNSLVEAQNVDAPSDTLQPRCESSKPRFEINEASSDSTHEVPNETGSQGSLSYNVASPHQQVCHTETVEVVLVADRNGFGMSLGSLGYPEDIMHDPPFVNFIEPKSVAERSGVIQAGDRILAINGQELEGRSLDAAIKLLNESGLRITLVVEFDVSESVVQCSGILNVKVARNGAGLGLTIAPTKNRRSHDPLLISAVKRGSVAHRTGTIAPGDKLLAVDNFRLEGCSVEDAAHILQNTAPIVQLRVQKAEAHNADDGDAKNSITYTVELQRNSGPLGITISGTEESCDPVFISGLSEGGLAEKTGALHVGDRILSINQRSLTGRTLTDAIKMLQNAGQTVTLKISRPLQPTHPHKCGVTGKSHNSIDSALESWDSSGLDSNGTKTSARPRLQRDGSGSSTSTASPREMTQPTPPTRTCAQSTTFTTSTPYQRGPATPITHLPHPQDTASSPQPTSEASESTTKGAPSIGIQPSSVSNHPQSINRETTNGRTGTARKATSYNDMSQELHYSYGSDSSSQSADKGRDKGAKGPDIGGRGAHKKDNAFHCDIVRPKTTMVSRPKVPESLRAVVGGGKPPHRLLGRVPESNSVISSLDQDEWSRQIDQLDSLGTLAVHSQSDSFSAFNSQSVDATSSGANENEAGAHQKRNSLSTHSDSPSPPPPPPPPMPCKHLDSPNGHLRSDRSPSSSPPLPPPPDSLLINNFDTEQHTTNISVDLEDDSITAGHSTEYPPTSGPYCSTFQVEPSPGADVHLREVEDQLRKIFTPAPAELLRVSLSKVDEPDFGMSLSDGVYEKGVYISAIRPNGPAERAKLLQFDRIFQINSRVLHDMECRDALPLIAAGGSQLQLIVSRNPLAHALLLHLEDNDDASSIVESASMILEGRMV